MPEQIIIPYHKPSEKDREGFIKDILEIFKVAAANEKTLPYIAALGFGLTSGYMVEKTWEGSLRMGLEAVVFTHLASMENNLPAQTFGIAGLASIGFTIPLAAIAGSLSSYPWVSPELREEIDRAIKEERPLDFAALGLGIQKWWEDLQKEWAELWKPKAP